MTNIAGEPAGQPLMHPFGTLQGVFSTFEGKGRDEHRSGDYCVIGQMLFSSRGFRGRYCPAVVLKL
jgi:hypothetical protein